MKRGLEINPDDDKLYLEIGKCRAEMGKLSGAMKYINKAIKINPNSENYLNRVKARESIYKRKDFIEKLNSGKSIEECDYIYNEKQAQDDIKDLTKALDIDPEDTDCLRLKILRYTYLKQYENALFDCETLIELEPDNKEYLWAYAHTLFKTKNFKKAIESFDNYLKMNDNIGDDFLYLTRGKANYELGDFKEAIKDFSKGLLYKETSELYCYRALANYKLKHFILSYKDFKKALEIDSEIKTKSELKIPKVLKIFLNKKAAKKENNNIIGLSGLKKVKEA